MVGDDASELVVSRVSKQECATRIHGVLRDREKWLTTKGFPVDHQMTWEERGKFLEWITEEFQKTPIEADLIAQARRDGKTASQIRKASRSRFNLEKQRRAGCSQIWELLSFSGDCTPEFLNEALETKANNSVSERVDEESASELTARAREIKQNLRYGKMLQLREKKHPHLARTLSG